MTPRLTPRRRLSLILILAGGCIVVIWGYQAWDRREIIRGALNWARLAPLPNSARNLDVSKSGSMFSRSFRVCFQAPVADIDQWLQVSPGTRGLTPERHSTSERKYEISPGGGAQHGEVSVDEVKESVTIIVYWS